MQVKLMLYLAKQITLITLIQISIGSTQGFSITGANAGDHSGYSVSIIGDFNDDGYGDIIIGAPSGSASKGISYVILDASASSLPSAVPTCTPTHKPTLPPRAIYDVSLSTLNPNQGIAIIGSHTGDGAGFSVSNIGDFNGDGYDDVVIGAYNAASSKGISYVIFGKASGFSDINLASLSLTQGFSISGSNTDQTGWSVSGAGDINNDSYDDIIISARLAPYAATVIFGKANSSNIALATLTN